MLSSHLFLRLPCLLPPFTVPYKMVLERFAVMSRWLTVMLLSKRSVQGMSTVRRKQVHLVYNRRMKNQQFPTTVNCPPLSSLPPSFGSPPPSLGSLKESLSRLSISICFQWCPIEHTTSTQGICKRLMTGAVLQSSPPFTSCYRAFIFIFPLNSQRHHKLFTSLHSHFLLRN